MDWLSLPFDLLASADPPDSAAAVGRALLFLLTIALLLAVFFLAVLMLGLARLRRSDRKAKQHAASAIDPWAESARRLDSAGTSDGKRES